MFAVIKTGGKQYKVAADNTITVMALPGEAGRAGRVRRSAGPVRRLDQPRRRPAGRGRERRRRDCRAGARPQGHAFKKRRRKNSKRKRGHRQDLTIVRVTDILTGGEAQPRKRRLRRANRQNDGFPGAVRIALWFR